MSLPRGGAVYNRRMDRNRDVVFSDAGSFLSAMSPLRECTFEGRDLACDPAGNVTLALAVPDAARRGSFTRTIVTVRGAGNYRQSLTAGPAAVYVLDRAEVGRGGREIAFYFRPGDRAVMDVERIEGSVRGTGERVPPHKRPAIANPLAPAARGRGFIARLFGRA